MADGIPYFPLDVYADDKIRLIEAEFGLKGFAIIVKLYQKIYGGFGYYCEWTNDVGLLFSQDVCEGYSSVSEIVSAAIRRGIFDKDLYEKYQILTSRGVQKRYFSAVSRRKQINVKSEYLLVEVAQFSENVNILSENVCRNAKNVCNLQQSKEKNRKEENRKEKKKKNARPQGGYDRILSDIEDEELKNLYYEYIKMRKLIKAPLTDRALRMLIDKVCALEPENIARQKQLLENSIVNSWKSVYPLKGTDDRKMTGGVPAVKKSPGNNYIDTNEINYDELEERIFARMIEDDPNG